MTDPSTKVAQSVNLLDVPLSTLGACFAADFLGHGNAAEWIVGMDMIMPAQTKT